MTEVANEFLESLKKDCATMMNYKGWMEAVRNVSKEDLSESWLKRIEGPINVVINLLDVMIEECKFYIARYEVRK